VTAVVTVFWVSARDLLILTLQSRYLNADKQRKDTSDMKFDKFTVKAQEALATAQQIAMAKSHTLLSPLHLLSATVSDDDGAVRMILKKIGANIGRIRDMTESELSRLPTGTTSDQIMPDPALGQVVLSPWPGRFECANQG